MVLIVLLHPGLFSKRSAASKEDGHFARNPPLGEANDMFGWLFESFDPQIVYFSCHSHSCFRRAKSVFFADDLRRSTDKVVLDVCLSVGGAYLWNV
jgi:hypothetical protein